MITDDGHLTVTAVRDWLVALTSGLDPEQLAEHAATLATLASLLARQSAAISTPPG